MPDRYALQNRRWELAVRAWRQCFLGHRLAFLTALGLPLEIHADEVAAEPRDRIALERRYYLDAMRPADLPCWYLVTNPPCLPRTNVHQYTFGCLQYDGAGRVVTPVIRGAGWTMGPGELPRPVPPTIVAYEPDPWSPGHRVPSYDIQNREYDADAQDWANEIQIRKRRWPMRPFLSPSVRSLTAI